MKSIRHSFHVFMHPCNNRLYSIQTGIVLLNIINTILVITLSLAISLATDACYTCSPLSTRDFFLSGSNPSWWFGVDVISAFIPFGGKALKSHD
jgi:hypothetical protein